jgi:hypothetical protein
MQHINFKKNTDWEYWPSYMFYLPVVPYAIYLAIKSRSFGFFSAVNPTIEGSGNGLESKFETVELIPKKYRPKTFYVKNGTKTARVLSKINSKKITFPLIIKPDIGFRGLLVKKINSEKELSGFIKRYNSINLIIQEFIELKNECGIFYHRIPGKKTGTITSITLKKYLTVIGDGISTLSKLIMNDDRAKIYYSIISEINKDKLETIPKLNEEIVLTSIGNHSKGTQFINGNNLISKELTMFFDNLSNTIDGWYYGRVDIKYANFDELVKGKNLKILEINGIISEPTHIYDATNGTYFEALKAIKNHWKIIQIIGQKNKQLKKANFTNLFFLIQLYFNYNKYLKKVKKLAAS